MDDLIPRALSILATTPMHWLSLTTMLPRDLLEAKPTSSEWSAAECLQHLLDTERGVFPVRVRCFLHGEELAAFDPDSEGSAPGERSPSELAAEFAERRRDSLTLLGTISQRDLQRNSTHSELGLVSLEEMVHEWVAHDLNHTVQAEQSLMQPFIAGCGPWRSYFAAHDMDRF